MYINTHQLSVTLESHQHRHVSKMKTKTNIITCILCLLTTAVFAQDLIPFNDKNGKFGYIDRTGRVIVAPKYTYVEVFDGDFAEVGVNNGLNNKCGFIDRTGKIVVPLKYNAAGPFSQGLAWVQRKHKYGFVNQKGEEQIPLIFQDAKWFSEGLAAVKSDGKWGFINASGKTIIPFRYDDIGGMQSFYKGKVNVKLGDRYFDIDKNGNELK